MKRVRWIVLVLLSVQAYGHEHNVKHNMVLVGESEIFASHLVYKSPHNFQVILKINFNEKVWNRYLSARQSNVSGLMIFLLNPMDITRIASASSLVGTLISEDTSGKRTELETNVTVDKKEFQLLYFEEVPLSLSPTPAS